MGHPIPLTPPDLEPTEDYAVHFTAYTDECEGTFFSAGIDIKSGAIITQWFDDGFECVLGEGIFHPIPGFAERVREIVGPL